MPAIVCIHTHVHCDFLDRFCRECLQRHISANIVSGAINHEKMTVAKSKANILEIAQVTDYGVRCPAPNVRTEYCTISLIFSANTYSNTVS